MPARLSSPPPGLFSTRLNRRQLLKAAGIGGLLLGGGAWLNHVLRNFGPPMKGLSVFDANEHEVVEKFADALFPGPPAQPYSAEQIGVAKFVDLYVSNLYEDTQQLFRMLVRTLNLSTVLTMGAAFHYLSRARRQKAVEAWSVSEIRLRRAGYQSLSFAIHMGYYEDDRVRAAVGLTTGCPVATGRPDLWQMAKAGR
jgi:hypothetical protein